jgi:hypothetical protein
MENRECTRTATIVYGASALYNKMHVSSLRSMSSLWSMCQSWTYLQAGTSTDTLIVVRTKLLKLAGDRIGKRTHHRSCLDVQGGVGVGVQPQFLDRFVITREPSSGLGSLRNRRLGTDSFDVPHVLGDGPPIEINLWQQLQILSQIDWYLYST